jgi:predicted PP-loop superfamily ATPase
MNKNIQCNLKSFLALSIGVRRKFFDEKIGDKKYRYTCPLKTG